MNKTAWWISISISVVLIIKLISLWAEMSQYTIQPALLVNEQAVEEYLEQHWESSRGQPGVKIKTGIFIQSLNNFNSTEMNFSGYIWQHFRDGVPDYVGQTAFPELHYSFVIKRKFATILFVHLLPIFLVMTLLYGALLAIGNDKERVSGHGFSASSILGICISLLALFVVMHIHLRESFAGFDIVYLEYFFILIYFLLVLVSANTLLLNNKWIELIHGRGNLLLKTAYWPVVLLISVTFTMYFV